MKTRRRENLQTQTSISNSPSKIEYTGDKLKENIFREGFDKTKPNVIFSEELGNVENVEVVTLKSDEIGNLTEKILL